MHYPYGETFRAMLGQLSWRSLAFGAVFAVMAVAAFFVDVDAVLRFFNFIGKFSPVTLETGAVISALAAVPFFAMGLSIGADMDRLAKDPE